MVSTERTKFKSISVDAPSLVASTEKISDAQTSNGIKDAVCLVDIPMPSVDESQSDNLTTSKDGIVTSNANSVEPSPGETGNNSSEKSQNDLHRQFNLISVPPPPPPSEPKTTFSSNIVITPQRTVNQQRFRFSQANH